MGRLSVLVLFLRKLRSVSVPELGDWQTQREIAQSDSQETQERLTMECSAEDLLVITDLEGKFLKLIPRDEKTIGRHELELLGNSLQWMMIHPDHCKQATRGLTERLAAGRILNCFGVRFREKNGSYRWLSWRAVPHQGRIYAMARDETEQKQCRGWLAGSSART